MIKIYKILIRNNSILSINTVGVGVTWKLAMLSPRVRFPDSIEFFFYLFVSSIDILTINILYFLL